MAKVAQNMGKHVPISVWNTDPSLNVRRIKNLSEPGGLPQNIRVGFKVSLANLQVDNMDPSVFEELFSFGLLSAQTVNFGVREVFSIGTQIIISVRGRFVTIVGARGVVPRVFL